MKFKRYLSLFLCLLLALSLSVTVFAESDQYVIDEIGGLSDEEASELWYQADAVTSSRGVGVYVAMIEDYSYYGSSVEEAAEYIFDTMGYGVGDAREGIFLLLSMAERDYDIDVHGTTANRVFTSSVRSRIADEFLDDFRDNDWYDGFSDFISEADSYLARAADSDSYDEGSEYAGGSTLAYRLAWGPTWVASAILGILLALLISWIVRRTTMHSVAKKVEAATYVKGAAKFRVREDQFTHVTETRTKIERNESSGSGSDGGHSHSSGKF